jgi:hypothetical protein
VQPDDLASAVAVGRHRNYRGDRDNAAALALLQVSGVEPQIRPLAGERSVEESMDAFVDLFTELGNLRLADPRPIACTRSSTRRVETPPIQASWITAISAFSELFRASRNGGK